MIASILRLALRYRNLNWAFVDQGMVSGVNFLTGILIARYLGIAEFGRFSLVWLVVLFINSIQLALVVSPMNSIGPKQEADAELPYYGAVLIQQVIISLLAAFLIFFGISISVEFFPQWQVQSLALPLSGVIFTVQMQDFFRRYCFCRYRGGMAFANDAISYLGQLVLLTGLAQVIYLDSAMVLWIMAFTSGLALLFGSLQFRELVWERAIFADVLRSHCSFAKWLVASAILNRLSGNIFLVAAGALLGTSAVGALKAVQNIMGLTHILFLGMGNIVPITAARRYRDGGRAALKGYLLKVAFAGGGVTLTIAMIAALVPLCHIFGLGSFMARIMSSMPICLDGMRPWSSFRP